MFSGSGGETSYTRAETNGSTYYYKVFSKTATPCYAPGTVNTTAGLSARPVAASTGTTWSTQLVGGSMLKPGIAGNGTIHPSSNAG
ncbi:MAG: hypothetical protein DMD82_16430, partial [Candidatus Rokuibacteriota bacterium]